MLFRSGHRLVADDAVEIKRVSDKTLVGSSPEIIRHFVELRGIGIIDVKEIFGMGRCQSGFCQSRVVAILARELDCDPSEVLLEDAGSCLVEGPLKGVR